MSSEQTFSGMRVLVVEDDYYAANELAPRLTAAGIRVVGPSPDVEDALEKIESTPDLAGAVLDINLAGQKVFPVADELERRSLPYIFATAFDPDIVPARYGDKIVLRKPLEEGAVLAALLSAIPTATGASENARKNGILALLSEREIELILPYLRKVFLPRGAVLEVPDQNVNRIYFPLDCVVSVIAVGKKGSRIETGLIGKEGMTGVGVAVGDPRTPYELVNQIEGEAIAMSADDFRRMAEAVPNLSLLAERFSRSLGVQVSQTALSNGRFDLQQRLARWLLMVDDRATRPFFDLTHDYLAIMLGVRRPSVTDALHQLEGKRVLKATRSRLELRNRGGLIAIAGEAYGSSEAEHRRIMQLPLV